MTEHERWQRLRALQLRLIEHYARQVREVAAHAERLQEIWKRRPAA